jgi:hypothetical protein
MAGSRPRPKHPPSPPPNQDLVQSKRLAYVAVPGGPRQRDDEPPLLVQSDLSGEMAVSGQELDAISRLLGDVLDDILSGAGSE